MFGGCCSVFVCVVARGRRLKNNRVVRDGATGGEVSTDLRGRGWQRGGRGHANCLALIPPSHKWLTKE